MKKLNVFVEIGGKQVLAGTISGESTESAVFVYNRDYANNRIPISLSLPIRTEPFSPEETRVFFDGLLPEGFTRKSVARRLHLDEEDYLSILEGLGKECIGAIRIVPDEESGQDEAFYKSLSMDDVKRLAEEGATRSAEIVVNSHLSLTGASGKVGLYFSEEDGCWYQPFGTAPSTHIVKQSHVRLSNIVENEQLILLTAAKAGIPTAKSFIIRTPGDANASNRAKNAEDAPSHTEEDKDILLATKRYDRDLSHPASILDGLRVPLRLHQEDFAQALGIPSSEKYEHPGAHYLEKMFRLLRDSSADPMRDQLSLLDLLIFDVLIGNSDNHIKNLSLLYSPDLRSLRLAPAYDLVCTAVYTNGPSEMSIAIAGELDWNRIDRTTFADASSEIGIRKAVILREYDRLQKEIPAALEQSADELQKSGLHRAKSLKDEILETCRTKLFS